MTQPPPSQAEVLLVDDEEDILIELDEMLSGAGCACHKANSVKKALELLNLHPNIALIITDLRMPEESGLRLIQRLREHRTNHHIPIIVASGHADIEDVIDVLRLQVVDFLRKPIYHEQLLATISRVLHTTQNAPCTVPPLSSSGHRHS